MRANTPQPPIWIRLPRKGHCPYTGLCRSVMWRAIKTGEIETTHLRKPGSRRGSRLIRLESLLRFIEREGRP